MKCQSLLGKALQEHFTKPEQVASVFSSSPSLRNSSAGANFLMNVRVDNDSVKLFQTVFTPEDCFSVQFCQSTLIFAVNHAGDDRIWQNIFSFIKNLITKNQKYLEASLKSLEMSGNFIDDEQLFFVLSNLKRITKIDIGVCPMISASGIESVAANCSNLEVLGLHSWKNMEIDALQAHLLRLENLRTLDLRRSVDMTDSAIQSLSAKMGHHLSSLLFDYEFLSDDSLVALAQMPALRSLCLRMGVTDDACRILAQSTSITALLLDTCNISAEGVKHISLMKKLATLMMSNVGENFTDVSLEHISKMENLTSLLFYCAISNAGVELICKMKKLKVFDCSLGELDDDQLQKIRDAIHPGKVELLAEECDSLFFNTFNCKNM